MNKIPLTIYLDLASYEKIQQAVEHASFDTVGEWLEHELNNNTHALVDMLLSDW